MLRVFAVNEIERPDLKRLIGQGHPSYTLNANVPNQGEPRLTTPEQSHDVSVKELCCAYIDFLKILGE